jgi:hypothetical protein
MVRFLAGAAASEVYRAAIEHEVGRELTSVARECSVVGSNLLGHLFLVRIPKT